jgi:stage V sporulation protein G
MSDTVAVEFEVISVERVRAGPVVGLATVGVAIAGVVVTLQGIRVTRRHDGSLECSAPTWRHPLTGKNVPGVVLPPELSAAVAREVLAAVAPYPRL